jgi:hypothetical protein
MVPSENELAFLEVTAGSIQTTVPEYEIEDEELKAVRIGLFELRNEIGNAEIAPEFKAVMLSQLTRMIEAILDYRIIGAPGLRRAAAEGFGEIMMARAKGWTPEEAPWVTKFFVHAGRLADLAALAMAAREMGLQLADWMDRIPLPGGS